MHLLIVRVLEICIAYILTSYLFHYFKITLPPSLIVLSIITIWLSVGHHLKARLKYQGPFSSWYAPITRANETVLCTGAATIAILSAIQSNAIFNFHISLVVLSIGTAYGLIDLLCFKVKKPLATLILLASTLETYFIYVFLLTKSQTVFFHSQNVVYLTLILALLIILIFQCNYFFLRNFMFYQKLLIQKNQILEPLNYRQKLNIAVHEASHLLMYSFYKEVPKDIQLLLFKQSQKVYPNTHGVVLAKVAIYNNASFMRWQMMLSISGIRGELLIFADHSHGSESDFQMWRNLAHTYLTRYDDRYTSQPITTAELNLNKVLETQLYQDQIHIIDKFLKNNKGLLLKVARQALVFNKLTYRQIYPHFKNIKMINEMPRET